MDIFNLFKGSSSGPYKKKYLNELYNLFFCDKLDLYKNENKLSDYPFNVLFGNGSESDLQEIISNKTLDSRYKLLSYNLLRSSNKPTGPKILLGVITEMSMPDGLDVLAAYADGTARYINHSEKLIVWESPTADSNKIIENLFSAAIYVVNHIGPWDKERRHYPPKGNVRLTFLVSDGLYFGEGPIEILQKDSMGGPVIRFSTELLVFLINQLTNTDHKSSKV